MVEPSAIFMAGLLRALLNFNARRMQILRVMFMIVPMANSLGGCDRGCENAVTRRMASQSGTVSRSSSGVPPDVG